MEVKVFTLDELNKAQFRTAYGWAGGGSYGGKKGRGKDKKKRKSRKQGYIEAYRGIASDSPHSQQFALKEYRVDRAIKKLLKKRVLAEKSIPIEEPFEKSRIIGAKDKKKRKSHGKYWDNPNNYVHRIPASVMEATVHQAAKDWDMPKSKVRKLLKEKLAEKKAKKTMADMPGRIPGYSLG